MRRVLKIVIILTALISTCPKIFAFRDFFTNKWSTIPGAVEKWEMTQKLAMVTLSIPDDKSPSGENQKITLTQVRQSEGQNSLKDEVVEIMLQTESGPQISLRKIYDNHSAIPELSEPLPGRYNEVLTEEIRQAAYKHSYAPTEHIAFFKSKDENFHLIQSGKIIIFWDNTLNKRYSWLLTEPWKEISAAECRSVSETLTGKELRMENEWPPFLVLNEKNCASAFTKSATKHGARSIPIDENTAKRLLRGAIFGKYASNVKLTGYCKWGENYILQFSLIPSYFEDCLCFSKCTAYYTIMYDKNGRVLDSIMYKIKDSSDTYNENSNRINLNIILDDIYNHNFEYEILPDRFLMTNAKWNCNKNRNLWTYDSQNWMWSWSGDPQVFLHHFPLTSLDYYLWRNVYMSSGSGEFAEDINGWLASVIVIDPDGFKDWVNRSDSEQNSIIRGNTLDKNGNFRMLDSFYNEELQLEFFNEWIQ